MSLLRVRRKRSLDTPTSSIILSFSKRARLNTDDFNDNYDSTDCNYQKLYRFAGTVDEANIDMEMQKFDIVQVADLNREKMSLSSVEKCRLFGENQDEINAEKQNQINEEHSSRIDENPLNFISGEVMEIVGNEQKNEHQAECSSTVSNITCNGRKSIRIEREQFVYDLYLRKSSEKFAKTHLPIEPSQLVDVRMVDEQELEDFLDEDDQQVLLDDEDDSNDEGNWRNDYPDEDEDDNGDSEFDSENSENEACEMTGRFDRFCLNEDDDDL